MFDGLSLEAGVLAAMGIAPKPQQHCRAVVLQGDFKGPFRLLCRARLTVLPCKTTGEYQCTNFCIKKNWRLLYWTQTRDVTTQHPEMESGLSTEITSQTKLQLVLEAVQFASNQHPVTQEQTHLNAAAKTKL